MNQQSKLTLGIKIFTTRINLEILLKVSIEFVDNKC